jgi:solute carrier family 13 (sodium-dependent dicarboxylate transporter), member 2/3/5
MDRDGPRGEDTAESADDALQSIKRYRLMGIALGPVIFVGMILSPTPVGMSAAAWAVAAVGLLMAVWWATEAIPVPATALLPLVLFPVLGIADIRDTAAPFANPLVFLFLGGFLIALAMQRWRLHQRIALQIVTRVGGRPDALIAGFMVATAFLSMWISNTATTMMMLPIAVSVIQVVATDDQHGDLAKKHNVQVALLLGIAYAASIGGIGTLIGTPPNALLAAFMSQTYQVDIGFARWMLLGLPVVVMMLPLAWFVLVRLIYPVPRVESAGAAVIAQELAKLGPMSPAEQRVLIVASLTALAWVSRSSVNAIPGLEALSDAGIAISGGLVLFLIPSDRWRDGFLMNWKTAQSLPFGTLILFGGGLSLAAAVNETGLDVWIGESLPIAGTLPHLAVIAIVSGAIIILTELTSNTATTAAFLPVVAALALSGGYPALALAAPAALAASCAFMLPVATPPNAIVHGTELVSVPQMLAGGVLLNVIGLAVVTGVAWLLVPVIF